VRAVEHVQLQFDFRQPIPKLRLLRGKCLLIDPKIIPRDFLSVANAKAESRGR
jgi:hypothetical protein